MPRYFDDPANLERLDEALAAWRGAPFLHLGRGRRGVDCIGFVWAVYRDAGGLRLPTEVHKRLKEYPKHWYVHGEEELLLDAVRAVPRLLETIPGAEYYPVNGDLLLYRADEAARVSHAAIWRSGRVWHCLPKVGVVAEPCGRWGEIHGHRLIHRFTLQAEVD